MLLLSWLFGLAKPNIAVFVNVVVIVLGVAVASYGEVHIVWLGFLFQAGGIFAEAMRLIMIQILLGGDGKNAMDPLVSLYYYAPVCAVMNFLIALVTEWSTFELAFVWKAGVVVLVANATIAFLLNVASVLLVSVAYFSEHPTPPPLPNSTPPITATDRRNRSVRHLAW